MTLRISGLASGMDTESIIRDMMNVARVPLDKLTKKQQTLEWKRDDYRNINTQLLNFRSELTNMKLTTSYRSRLVTTSDSSKVSVTATSAASVSSSNMTKVEQLAAAEIRKNSGSVTNNTKEFDLNKSIYNQKSIITNNSSFVVDESKNSKEAWKKGKISTDTISISSAGKEFSINASGKDLKDIESWSIKVDGKAYKVVTKATNQDETAVINTLKDSEVYVNELGEMTFKKEFSAGSNISVKYIEEDASQYYTTFSMTTMTSTGEQFENFVVSSEDSLNAVMSNVNNSKLGVSMFYDSYSGEMTLNRTETGNFEMPNSPYQIQGEGSFLTGVLQFDFFGKPEQSGQNAEFTINGISTQRNTNTFDISGVTYTLKQIFGIETDANGQVIDSSVTVNVSNNSSDIYDNIKSFVDKYNELISTVQSKIGEERNRDYEPLTDEEKEALSEMQIEKWENIAKMGLLRNDTTLSSALSNLRLNLSSTVVNGEISSLYNTLSKIGITTTSNYLEGGKLEINEAKLKAAIEADPSSVEQLFRGENGIVDKLTDTVNNTMENIKLKAGNSFSTNQTFTLGRELDSVDDRISSLQDRLEQMENRYWKQFTAMETAIQRGNEQYASLSSFFSTGQ